MFGEPILLIWMMIATVATELSHFPINRGVLSYYNMPRQTFSRNDEDIIKVLEKEYERYEPPDIRRSFVRPSVEVGPGVFKSEIVQYPGNLLKKQLNHLMKLKKKMDDRKKNLNP